MAWSAAYGWQKKIQFFFQILFYSVMQEHTGARDGGVRGGVAWRGCGLRAAQKKFSIFFFNFFLFSNFALWWKQYECSGGHGKN